MHMHKASWVTLRPLRQELSFLEFFAGAGRVWKAMRADSVEAVGVDINYWGPQLVDDDDVHQNPFDILSNAGMGRGPQLCVFLPSNHGLFVAISACARTTSNVANGERV